MQCAPVNATRGRNAGAIAPYIDGPPDPFALRNCFELPYQATNTGQDCTALNGNCKSGICGVPSQLNPGGPDFMGSQTGEWGYHAPEVPVVVGVIRKEDAASQSADVQAQLRACPSGGLLVTDFQGERSLICPLSASWHAKRNCSNCLKTVYQCNELAGLGSDSQLQQCRQMESCMQYNIRYPDGQLEDVGYKVTPECIAPVQTAISRCRRDCALTISGNIYTGP